MMDHINTSKYLPAQRDSPKPRDPNVSVSTNRTDPPLDGGHSTNIGGMWTLKHDIRSPKLYELIIKTELKGYIDVDLKNFYNHIKMCLNAVTILR